MVGRLSGRLGSARLKSRSEVIFHNQMYHLAHFSCSRLCHMFTKESGGITRITHSGMLENPRRIAQ